MNGVMHAFGGEAGAEMAGFRSAPHVKTDGGQIVRVYPAQRVTLG